MIRAIRAISVSSATTVKLDLIKFDFCEMEAESVMIVPKPIVLIAGLLYSPALLVHVG